MAFPTKTSAFGRFSSLPPRPPPSKAKILFLLLSRRLWATNRKLHWNIEEAALQESGTFLPLSGDLAPTLRSYYGTPNWVGTIFLYWRSPLHGTARAGHEIRKSTGATSDLCPARLRFHLCSFTPFCVRPRFRATTRLAKTQRVSRKKTWEKKEKKLFGRSSPRFLLMSVRKFDWISLSGLLRIAKPHVVGYMWLSLR